MVFGCKFMESGWGFPVRATVEIIRYSRDEAPEGNWFGPFFFGAVEDRVHAVPDSTA